MPRPFFTGARELEAQVAELIPRGSANALSFALSGNLGAGRPQMVVAVIVGNLLSLCADCVDCPDSQQDRRGKGLLPVELPKSNFLSS